MWRPSGTMCSPTPTQVVHRAWSALRDALRRSLPLDFDDFEPEPLRDEELYEELLRRP